MTTNLEAQLAALPGADTGSIDSGDMAELLGGLLGQGDSGPTPHSERTPGAASTALEIDPAASAGDAAAAESGTDAGTAATAPTPEPKQVILARDGMHTIPFERLEEARQTAAALKAQAEALARENAELKAAQANPSKAPATAAPAAGGDAATDGAAGEDDDETLFGDYSGAAMKKAVLTLATQVATKQVAEMRKEMNARISPAEEAAKVDEATAHYQTILTKHPDAHSIVESTEYAQWLGNQPRYARSAIEAAIQGGTAAEVVEVLDAYRAERPRAAASAPAAAPAAPSRADAAALADKALSQAKSRTPTSLSDIPAGTQIVTDEAEAIKGMEPTALLDQMLSMSPSQRDEYINRVV